MKKEKQLTAVQWLVDQMFTQNEIVVTKETNSALFKLLEKAKEMEKEQILAAHSDWSRITENLPTRSAVQYFKETFKSE